MGNATILDAIELRPERNPESIYIDLSAAAYIDDLLMHGFPVKARSTTSRPASSRSRRRCRV